MLVKRAHVLGPVVYIIFCVQECTGGVYYNNNQPGNTCLVSVLVMNRTAAVFAVDVLFQLDVLARVSTPVVSEEARVAFD